MKKSLSQHGLLLGGLGLWLLGLLGCTGAGSFYRRHSPASYYATHYCFELPRAQVSQAVKSVLQRYRFAIAAHNPQIGVFRSKPAHIKGFDRHRYAERGYEVTLTIKLKEQKGKISLKGIPRWALDGKSIAPPAPPSSQKYPNPDDYQRVLQAYQERLDKHVAQMDRGVKLMRDWQGCSVRRSTIRTLVQVNATLKSYPYGAFNSLKRTQGKLLRSDKSFEYTFLHVLAKKLGRRRYMRRLMIRLP